MSKITGVIAELRDEQARLRLELSRIDRVLEALEGALVSDPEERAELAAPAAAPAAVPPPTSYVQYDLYEATTLYLARVGEPQTARQIADGLRAGGFQDSLDRLRRNRPDHAAPAPHPRHPRHERREALGLHGQILNRRDE